MTRAEQLSANLAAVQQRIETAVNDAGRGAGDVRLVVVTKFFPASDVWILARLGVAEVAENRHQEAEAKIAECAEWPECGSLRWHFVGGLQTNKAAAVGRYADIVESVDRPELLTRLARGAAERALGPLDVLLQVSLDPPGAGVTGPRSGAAPQDLSALAEQAAATDGLRLRGLMAVAPLGEPPEAAFERLARIRERFLEDHPEATILSAGMSGDLEQAIAAGATHVRVGSAVLGSRAAVK